MEIAHNKGYRRINFASAIQPDPFKQMPDLVTVCNSLCLQFAPERIRVVQLAFDQFGGNDSKLTKAEVDGLRKLDVEVVSIDARRSTHPAEPGNIRILADFFDFS